MMKMALKVDQERVRTLLRDTITLLCKNGLSFKNQFSIEAVIGVTLDEDDVFLVSMNEIIQSDRPVKLSSEVQNLDSETGQSKKNHRRPRKRKRMKAEGGSESAGEVISSSEDENIETSNIIPSDDADCDLGASPIKVHAGNDREKINRKVDNGTDTKPVIHIKEEVNDSVWTGTSAADTSLHNTMADFTAATNFDSHDLSSFMQQGAPQLSWISQPSEQTQMVAPTMSRVPRTATATSDANLSQNLDDTSLNSTFDPQQIQSLKGPFTCSVCGKMFDRRYSWMRHENWHQGKFECYCPQCHKGFSSTSTLKGHIANVHTGQKDYKCELCDKEYAYKHHLKDHIKRNHAELCLQ